MTVADMSDWAAERRRKLDHRAAQERRRWRERESMVYRLEWSDGMIYVGITKHTLNQRLTQHRRDCSVVGRRLDVGWPPVRADIVFQDADRDLVEFQELISIREIPKGKRLNVVTPLEDWEKTGR